MNFKKILKHKAILSTVIISLLTGFVKVLADPPDISPTEVPANTSHSLKSAMTYNFKTRTIKELQEACGFISTYGRITKIGCTTPEQQKTLQRIVGKAYKEGKINAPYFRGNTLLHYAAIFDCPYLIDLLKQAGANMNIISSNKCKNTPIHLAIYYKNIDAISSLLKYNARLDIPNAYGNIPVITAIYKSFSFDFMRNLFPPGYSIKCDKKFMNKKGKTPLSLIGEMRPSVIARLSELPLSSAKYPPQKKDSQYGEKADIVGAEPEESPEKANPTDEDFFHSSTLYQEGFGGSDMAFAPDKKGQMPLSILGEVHPSVTTRPPELPPGPEQYPLQEKDPQYEEKADIVGAEPEESPEKANPTDEDFFHSSELYQEGFGGSAMVFASSDNYDDEAGFSGDYFENECGLTAETHTPFIRPTPFACSTPSEPENKRCRADASSNMSNAFSRILCDVKESQNRIVKQLEIACGLTFKDGVTISRGWNLTFEQMTALDMIVNSTKQYHLLDIPHIWGHTLLYYAAKFNCPYLIKKLYDSGANLLCEDSLTGYTALQIAESHNSVEAFELLTDIIKSISPGYL